MHFPWKGRGKGKGKASSSTPGTQSVDDVDHVSETPPGPREVPAARTADDVSGSAQPPTHPTDETVPLDVHVMNLTGNPLASAELHPDTLWFDHNSVVRNVTKSIQSKFDGSYTSWSSTPSSVKDCWWRFFRDQYKWNPSIAEEVLRGYERKAGTRLKDMVYKLHKTKDTSILSWCPAVVRQQLNKRRETEEFQKKSGIYSANRTGGEYGGSLHAQGSISTPEVIRRMTLVVPPAASEVFAKSHRTKSSKFVDKRSQATWDRYENLKNSSETQEETVAGNDQVFFQAAGGWTEKGSVYGLGSGAHMFYKRSSSVNNSTSKVRNLELQVEEMRTERQQMRTQMNEQNAMILALKNAMEVSGIQPCSGQWPSFSRPPPPPPPPSCPPPLI
ncbi:hypothetical protein Ancab_040037 [Ancistrocladus abbreviatus]